MFIQVFGTDHTLLDLKSREIWIEWLEHSLKTIGTTVSYIPLITCNRCEIYYTGPTSAAFTEQLQKAFYASTQGSRFYLYTEEFCFRHLALVASGFLSADLGESDIRRQIKQAYEKRSVQQPLPSQLHYLFQKALHIGKQFSHKITSKKSIRLETLVLSLCARVSQPKTIFLLGNSQINRNLLNTLQKDTQARILFCSNHHSESFYKTQVECIDYSHKERWSSCEIVIAATKNQGYLIQLSPQPITTQLCIDLSVPRAIDPSLRKISGIHLVDMQEIGDILEQQSLMLSTQVATLKQEASLVAISYFQRMQQRCLDRLNPLTKF